MADEELKKAFQDLQFKTNETRMQIALGEQQKKALHQKKLISGATLKSLQSVDENLPYYRSIGRMFLLSDRSSELSRHEQEAKECSDKIDAITKKREYLEKNLTEAESNLREMIQTKRA